MSNILLISHLIVTVLLILVVLFQKSEGGGLGMGSDNQGFGTGATSANPLSRVTWILTSLFFIIAILLTIISANEGKNKSVFKNQPTDEEINEEKKSPELPNLKKFKKNDGVLTPPTE
tara:strand:- start:943 stop:1296 length:354 start_codon:yes stop_codon:yes gene_type:complete